MGLNMSRINVILQNNKIIAITRFGKTEFER